MTEWCVCCLKCTSVVFLGNRKLINCSEDVFHDPFESFNRGRPECFDPGRMPE